MPLYEYQCKKCGHRFERIQSFSAEDVKECPVCHGEVERLISTPARPQFKGSGFYSTDYSSKPASSPSSTTESSPTPAAKTESTPAPAAAPSTPSKSD
jgi:putative FmdB family regulatory protein